MVVGIDGSEGSGVALRWALDHADRMGVIEPVTTFVSGPFDRSVEASDPGGEPYRSEAVQRQRGFLELHAPWLVDAGVVIEQRPGPGLVKAAAAAELLVLGTHGWGQRIDLSVGSVGAYCARHATVPVALVPHHVPAPRDHLDVVVGVDGSPHGHRALRWALTHLRPSARVTAVVAFTEDSVAGEALVPATGAAEAAARAELETGVAGILAELPEHPTVELAALAGDARSVLLGASARADILVIGARGHGTLGHLLLGSVSGALVHHPTVPTIIVPHEHRHHRRLGE